MKELLLVSCYVVAALEIGLGVYFWVTNSGNEIRKVMRDLSFATGIWVLTSAMTSYIEYSTTGYYFIALAYLAGIVLMTEILELSFVFPFRVFHYDRLHRLLLFIPVLIFGSLSFFSHAIVESYTGSSDFSGAITGGSAFFAYNWYLVAVFCVAMAILLYKVTISSGFIKKLILLVIFSFLAGGLPSVFQYLILPNFNPNFVSNLLYGAIATVTWVGVTSYIVVRK